MDKPKTTTPRKGKVAPKVEKSVAAPLEMVPAPTVHLEINQSNIGAFRAFGKVNSRVLAFSAKSTKTLNDTWEITEAIVGWLLTYADANEAELDGLSFAELSQVWEQAGAVYTGTAIPQQKSAT